MDKFIVLADKEVGMNFVMHLNNSMRIDYVVCVTSKNEIWDYCKAQQIPVIETLELDSENLGLFSLGILAWWPFIIKKQIFSAPKYGFVNIHPSFLPFGRGKYPNVWAIIEGTPFGVTLHTVSSEIDSGKIVIRKELDFNLEDDAFSLYKKSLSLAIEILKEFIVNPLSYLSKELPSIENSKVHYASQLESLNEVDLDDSMTVRHFLNLVRARQFPGKTSLTLKDNDKSYTVQIRIVEN